MESVAQRYAIALRSIAREENRENDYLAAADFLLRTFQDIPDFFRLLSSEFIHRADRYKIVDATFKELNIPYFSDFVKLLIDRRRLRIYDEIVKEFRLLVNADNGIEEGMAMSATPLTEADLKKLEAVLSTLRGRKVHLSNRVESRLLGGVKVTIGDEVYDGSIANRISQLLERLHNGKAVQ